jgi:thiol-disulfide isomerase/thioredoxin
MRKSGLFAVLSLSAALPLFGANVRAVKEPTQVAKAFPAKAKVRVLNLWATWCAPCVAEMPDLRAIDETFGDDVAILGLSLDDMIPDTKPEKVDAFLTKYKIAFPNIYYTGNVDALAKHLDFDGELPVTIVFDRNGKELWRHQGRIEKDETIARLRELVRRTQ